jgi:hypothetical protein
LVIVRFTHASLAKGLPTRMLWRIASSSAVFGIELFDSPIHRNSEKAVTMGARAVKLD